MLPLPHTHRPCARCSAPGYDSIKFPSFRSPFSFVIIAGRTAIAFAFLFRLPPRLYSRIAYAYCSRLLQMSNSDHVTSSERPLLYFRRTPASKPVFIQPRYRTIDPLPITAKSLLTSRPKAFRPKSCRSPEHNRPTPQPRRATSKIVVPCRSRCSQPLANRISVWTMSLLRLGILLPRIDSNRTLFVCSLSPFCVKSLAPHSPPLQRFPLYLGPIAIGRRRFCLTLADHALAVAHLDTVQ